MTGAGGAGSSSGEDPHQKIGSDASPDSLEFHFQIQTEHTASQQILEQEAGKDLVKRGRIVPCDRSCNTRTWKADKNMHQNKLRAFVSKGD